MYEIYINDHPLRLIATSDLAQDQLATKPAEHLLARYSGKIKTLLHYADLLEKGSPKVTQVTIHSPDVDQLWADFQTHYKIVSAAGGVVNLKGTDTYLFIYRRGSLDLPKGKIDPGETIQTAALREVEEETGLSELKIVSSLPHGLVRQNMASLKASLALFYAASAKYSQLAQAGVHDDLVHISLHTYRHPKGYRVLKPTYWFAMQTEQIELFPQAEEDIDWARWMKLEDALDGRHPFYPSLQSLFE